MNSVYFILMAAAAVLLLLLFIKIIRLPLKWLFKLLLHAVVGFVALFVFNFLGSYAGIWLELNLFNAVITGILGVPGVILLLLFKYLL
ncbi:MAG: pro-sigmaK processing inhibitor BofA family protein [Clostridia bacterium]|nr:pro-sigmaK processing inhibitor BofA family protein [Clostridia bacterium]